MMLEVSHLAVDHGQLRALWDVSLHHRRRRAGGPARRQRRGQIDDAWRAARPLPPGRRHDPLSRPGRRRPRHRRQCRGRDCAGARRPAAVSGNDGARKSGDGRLCSQQARRRRRVDRTLLCAVSRAGGKGAPAGRPTLGRSAADGRDRPRADVAAQAPAARRAFSRRGPDHHRRGHGRAVSACRTKASRFCWSSRTSTAPWISSLAPMSSRTAEACSKETGRRCWAIRNSPASFSDWSNFRHSSISVAIEPVSASQFPANREKSREFCNFGRLRASVRPERPVISWLFGRLPYSK